MEKRPSNFEDYSKITDVLMYLSKDITLAFVTSLSRKDKAGNSNERIFFHSEVEYNDQWSIKRQMSFFFCLNEVKNFMNSIMLRPQDVALLLMMLDKQVLPWFIGSKRIYSIIDGKLVIKGEYNEVIYSQSEYTYIKLCPIICTYEDGQAKEGIRLYLNADDTFADMDLDRFMGFYYILKTTDMYAVACAMAGYVKTPPYGVNIYSPQGLGGNYNTDRMDIWDNNKPSSSKPATKAGIKRNAFLENVKRKEEESKQ